MNESGAVEKEFAFLDHVPIGVFVLQDDFVVLFWNSCLEDWTGISRSEVVGANIETWFPHLSDPRYTSRLQDVFKGGPPVIFSSQLHRYIIPSYLRDGRLRIQHATVTCVPTSDGVGFHALFAIQDVTELTRRIREYWTMRDQALEEARARKQVEDTLREQTRELDERVKELNCLYGISRLVEKPDVSLEEILQGTVSFIPSAWQYPEVTGARILLDDQEFRTENFEETAWRQTAGIIVHGERIGALEVCYLAERPASDQGPFLKEEKSLFSAIVERLGKIIERKWAEEALRQRTRELALFNRAGHAVSSSLDLDQVLVTLLEEVRHLMDVTACSVWLIDPETDELVCRQATGPQNERVRGWRLPQGEGLVGWTARNGESLIVADVRTDERHFKGVDQQTGLTLRSILSTPLWAKQCVIGVLQMVDTEIDRFSVADLELLEPLAASAVAAIENARLYEEIGRRNEELIALNAITATLNQSPDLDHILNKTMDKVLEVMGIDGGWVQLLDEDSGVLSLVAQRGFSQEMAAETSTIKLGESITGKVAQLGKLIVVDKVSDDPRLSMETGRREALHAFAGVPIKSRGKVLGVLGVFSRNSHQLNPQEVNLLIAIGHQIGVAVENARLVEEAAEVEILQELNRLRSELIANVSHELRTPLGLIKVFSTTLLVDGIDFDNETRQECLRNIDQETDKLEVIVDDLLDLSQMESAWLKLDKRPTDTGQLASEVIKAVQVESDVQAARHRFVHDFPADPLVATVDAKRIKQVLRNLLSNAIKYSPDGGIITVQGRGDERQLFVAVSDQGMGIPAGDLKRIFERFYRVDNNVTQSTRGAGLGLSVCRGIVEAHGGHIWAESTLGLGSAFYFTLMCEQGVGER